MPSATLPVIERQFGTSPTHSVIWLHGLGADGHDFYGIVPELKLPASAAVRFIFPHAPSMPVTLNGGYVMPAWYDILGIDGIDRQVDIVGIEKSVAASRELIAQEVERGIAEENIILAGFSQGGAIAYITALSHPKPLGGIMALSTYLPAAEHWTYSTANKNIPIYIAHGGQDPVVPYSLGQQAFNVLQTKGYTPAWHSYVMQHSVCPSELKDIGLWLEERLR